MGSEGEELSPWWGLAMAAILGSAWAKGECPLHVVRRKWASECRGQALGMPPGALRMGQLQFNPGLLPTHWQRSYRMVAYSGPSSRQTHRQQKICNHQSLSGKEHFVLHILIENRAGSSEQGEPKHRLLPWKAPASQGGLWFSFLPFQSPYDL